MKLVAIDGNSILNRAFYGVKPLRTSNGFLTNAIYGFFNVLSKILNEEMPDYVVVAFDVKAKTFRHNQCDSYKANRKPMPQELYLQLVEVKKMVSMLGLNLCERVGFEADDLLGTLSKICSNQGVECVIASGDRDVLQLVGPYVKVRLSKNIGSILFDEEKIFEEYGVSPQQLIEVKSLMGDASDNITGVKGIGEKTALKLVSEFGTVEHIFNNLDNIRISKRVRALLTASGAKESCFLSKKLATICLDVDLNENLEVYSKKEVDWKNLKCFLEKFELKTILNSFSKNVFFSNDSKINELTELNLNSGFDFERIPVVVDENLSVVKSKLKLQDVIYFFFEEEILVVVTPNEIYRFCESKIEAFKVLIAENLKPKKTSNLKDIYKFSLENGFELQNVVFSCDLAAYLINVLEKEHDLLSLTEKFFGIKSVSDCFINLCSVLEKEINVKGLGRLFYEIELPLTLILAEMEICGFEIDKRKLAEFGNLLKDRIEFYKNEIWDFCGTQFNINSTKELATVLFDKLNLPKSKKTKTGYSTERQELQKLVKYSEVIPKILNYRTLNKLFSTYVTGLQKVLHSDCRVHSVFKQTQTRTGRISSTEPNIQNIPIRTEIGSEMRKFFVAHSGSVLVDCDYSQIELRILASVSNDENMILAFNSDQDIHSITASKLFDCEIQNISKEFRRRAKVVNFSVVYGIGPFSLAQDLGITLIEAKRYIDSFFEIYSGVKKYFNETVELAKKTGAVRTLFGRIRKIPELNSRSKKNIALGERIAKNTPIQGSCADLIKIAMIKIRNRLKDEHLKANLILQVHDELLVESDKVCAERVAEIVKLEMENVVKLKVPLIANVSIGKTWFDC